MGVAPKSKKINKDSKVAKKVLYPHITSHVLMVEPTQFFLNEETFKDNKFMERVKDSKSKSTQEAIQEFKKMAENLKKNGVTVSQYKQMKPDQPDAVFPNNWFSTHKNEIIPGKWYFLIYFNRRPFFYLPDESCESPGGGQPKSCQGDWKGL